MKTCRVCKIKKEFTEFNKKSSCKDGLNSDCRECSLQQMKNWRKRNPEADKQYQIRNPQKCKNSVIKYRTSPKGKAVHAKIEAQRRASKLQATPKWLTFNQRQEILEIYKLAADLSWLSELGLHVDHIVPLKGENVCGLHVPWNLQILPAIENIKKSNKLAI